MMGLRATAAILLALTAAACNRAGTNNSANGVAAVPPAQGNVVLAPPLAPPATANAAEPVAEDDAAAEAGKAAGAQGCAGEIGQRAAVQLALQCRDVSPATRPPCNVANSCAMIREEIARGCGMLGADAPDFCPPGG